jgi:hypothetical protein
MASQSNILLQAVTAGIQGAIRKALIDIEHARDRLQRQVDKAHKNGIRVSVRLLIS